jgi:Na+-translocating ferredoxin:NAD+ oxidoreductase RnfG subunit
MIRNLIRFVVILSVACLVIGGGVAALYGVFKGDLAARDLQTQTAAIQAVCPPGAAADLDHPIAGRPPDPAKGLDPEAVYVVRTYLGPVTVVDGRAQPVAYVAAGEAHGYSSVVRVMVSARPADLAVLRVVVVAQAETPGLGTTVAETRSTYTLWQKLFGSGEAEQWVNAFLDQFTGKQVQEFPQIHGVTAATITSDATKRAVEQALERIREAAGKKGTGAGANE